MSHVSIRRNFIINMDDLGIAQNTFYIKLNSDTDIDILKPYFEILKRRFDCVLNIDVIGHLVLVHCYDHRIKEVTKVLKEIKQTYPYLKIGKYSDALRKKVFEKVQDILFDFDAPSDFVPNEEDMKYYKDVGREGKLDPEPKPKGGVKKRKPRRRSRTHSKTRTSTRRRVTRKQ